MVCPERRPPKTLLTKVLCAFGPDDEELDAKAEPPPAPPHAKINDEA